ncbi:MAG: cytochrome c biogenesis protein ResB [Candidatus Eisenbacteria bacterium]|nr:cytochrome c biogenesis protein ResB [Candidatus Eisenbacteria bacterium]
MTPPVNPGEGNLATPTKQETARTRSIPSSIHSFLSSSRFGLVVLLVIGGVSLVGMFIMQNAPPEEYVSRYGGFWGNFLLYTGLASVYRVWWFLVLIMLSALNLILCSLKRIRPSFSQAFSRPKAEDNELLRAGAAVTVEADSSELSHRLARLLKKKGFAVASAKSGADTFVAGQKGGVSRIGFLVTHLGVLLVLAAGAVNGGFGYQHQVPVSVGDTLQVKEIEPSADFGVRVDDFTIDTNPEGQVRDWKSSLTVIEGGREVVRKVIEVNHPLTYGGISFYQASYGQDPSRIREARLLIVEGDSASAALDVPFLVKTAVPGTDVAVEVTRYVPDFVMDLATGIVGSRSGEPRLPAIKLEVTRGGQVLESGWLIMGMDIHGDRGELGRFRFVDFYPEFYTGLDVVTNPGLKLMLVAFGVITVGIFLSFLTYYRRVWVRVREVAPGRSELRVAGASSKHHYSLTQELSEIREFAKEKGKGS